MSEIEKFARELMDRARKINARVRSAVPATDHMLSSANSAMELADDQNNLTSLLRRLHSGDQDKVSQATEQLKELFPDDFKVAVSAENELARAQHIGHEKLAELTEQLEQTYEKNHRSWKSAVPKPKSAVEEEAKPGFFKRIFGEGKVSTALEEHANKMEARTKGERLGISIAQVGLGFVGINVGSSMLQQAASGVKRKKLFAEDPEGNKQLAAITAVPIGGGERTFRAATGAIITAAGIGSFMLGATNFSKSL